MTLTVLDAPPPTEPAVRVLGAGLTVVPAPRSEGRPGRHLRPARRRWVDHLLTLGAVLGLAMTALTIAAAVTGVRPMVVRSGSMEPTIRTGSLVLVRDVPAREARVGDVVAVQRPDGTRVTHRVVSTRPLGSGVQLVLKGDANSDVDPAPVAARRVGLFVATVPVVASVVGFLVSAKGAFVLGWLVAAVMLAVLRRPEP